MPKKARKRGKSMNTVKLMGRLTQDPHREKILFASQDTLLLLTVLREGAPTKPRLISFSV